MSGSKSPRDLVSRMVRETPRSGIRDFFDIVASRRDVISLSIGEPDFEAPWHVREAGIFALERGATSYTSNMGLPRLRRELARYTASAFGVDYDPEKEILVTVGVSQALDLALRAVLNPGDEVLIHQPCYVSYGPVTRFAGGRPVFVDTTAEEGFRLSRAALERYAGPSVKALLLNYPNNPTGAVLGRAALEEVAALARERDWLVLADDIYAELTYEGRHTSIAALPGMRERTLLLHGFSKAWAMTGLRMGHACGPPDIIEAMMKIHQYTMLCAPTPSQEAALEALLHPGNDVDDMRSQFNQRRRFLVSRLGDMGLPCVTPTGAFYAFPGIGEFGLSSRDFALRFLEEENVALVPGSAFGPAGEGHVRCSFAAALDHIKEAMVRLERFVAGLRRAGDAENSQTAG